MTRRVEHHFNSVNDQPARMLLNDAPDGFEDWFVGTGAPSRADKFTPTPPEPHAVHRFKLGRRCGVQFATPQQSKER